MNNSDYLPRKDADFLQWTVSFFAVLVKIFERIGFPAAVYQQLLGLKNEFDGKLRIAEAPEKKSTFVDRNRLSSTGIDFRRWKSIFGNKNYIIN
jgi:hypothetical protein